MNASQNLNIYQCLWTASFKSIVQLIDTKMRCTSHDKHLPHTAYPFYNKIETKDHENNTHGLQKRIASGSVSATAYHLWINISKMPEFGSQYTSYYYLLDLQPTNYYFLDISVEKDIPIGNSHIILSFKSNWQLNSLEMLIHFF